MLVNKHVNRLTPYIPGYQPDMTQKVIKLNSNENPYPPTPKIKNVLSQFINNIDQLRYYPESTSLSLREALSHKFSINKDKIFCGNGSDEIISLIFRVFLEQADKIVIPNPTYTVYKTVADIHKVACQCVETNSNFEVDIDALLASHSDAIFIANPNAPTSLLMGLDKIRYILDNYHGLLVIDEAYIDFADSGASAISMIDEYPNLLVLRTFSKSYSLCGARVGFCLGDEALIEGLNKCKDSYNLNTMSQYLAIAALEDNEYFMENIKKIISSRKYLTHALELLEFDVLQSDTNFLLCKPRSANPKSIYQFLAENKIFIRYFESPRINDKLRISIGTGDEIDLLLEKLKSYKL
ncbi:histidinol-phosphate transaminase [Paenibacillus sp. PAMC 26794]|uniref:histidinol-phosphate transaminase n=1 Tax=Paenibacillus sp. PAMC 26794 TaxID=1257080 RepID=UPI0002DAA570|nr:histidinol-phosphate transaminase [Paenibacillus sp. PAMC 26794]